MEKTPQQPRVLSPTQEKILHAFGELVPFATATDITRLMGLKKGSKAYVRSLMTDLAGGGDYRNHYLVRFGMPHAPGNFERIFTLGSRGRELLRERGIDVAGWFRVQKASPYSFSFLKHHLGVTHFLVALHAFCREFPLFQLQEARTGFALARNPPRLPPGLDGEDATIAVLPDAWAYVERSQPEPSTSQGFPLWIEVDCGTEGKAKFQHLVRERLALLRSGQYEAHFATRAVVFCYLAVGASRDYRLDRLHTMRQWVAEVLEEQELEDWARVFHFSTIDEHLYDTLMLFTDPVWFRPDEDSVVPLFPTHNVQEETHVQSTSTPTS
jgi:hypothetical protein